MFQEIKLVGIQKIIEGGSTHPLLINGQREDREIRPYVLKNYKKSHVVENYTVAKEIICSEVAKEFDLPVPDFALVQFDHSALSNFYSKEKISGLDTGYKFCSEYHEGVVDFNRFVASSFLKSYETENVFAFDNIILNADRGNKIKKTNLLIIDKEMLLIDHELTLPFIDNKTDGMVIDYKSKFSSYNHSKHIFTEVLKRRRKKENIFDEFHEHLRCLNLEKCKAIIEGLDSFNIDCGEKKRIFGYLVWLKKERDFVCKKLKERIL